MLRVVLIARYLQSHPFSPGVHVPDAWVLNRLAQSLPPQSISQLHKQAARCWIMMIIIDLQWLITHLMNGHHASHGMNHFDTHLRLIDTLRQMIENKIIPIKWAFAYRMSKNSTTDIAIIWIVFGSADIVNWTWRISAKIATILCVVLLKPSLDQRKCQNNQLDSSP